MKLLNISRLFCNHKSNSICRVNASTYKVGKIIHGYEIKRVAEIPTFSMTAIELEHTKTGSAHLHLAREDNNNVFNVLLRTTPMNSTGVAHVLEHVVLCGSQKYPVRDPFFKMLNRSMSSFMNAMTGPDYTMYPFSTQHAQVIGKVRTSKDFQNLLAVYLDAVFFPRIRKLDFLQEGWRLEHEIIEDKNSPIVFKGVVFNEMKGLLADPNYLYGTAIQNHLLPDHTYGVCSGGKPSDIPNLTWKDLQEFHQSHYHPSNAKFITYGNLPLEDHLKFINESVMSKFERVDADTNVPPQQKWSTPTEAMISCPVDAMAAQPDKQTTVSVNYLLPEVSDVEESMIASVVCMLLTEGPGSPFYESLIESGLGSDYSPNTGYHEHTRDAIFSVGLQGISPDDKERVEQLIMDTIDRVVENGFPQERVDAILHRIELQIKHQSSNFGLGLTFNLMPVWQHGADPLKALHVDKLVNNLKLKIAQDSSFLSKKCEEYFKKNQHRLTLVMNPDENFKEEADEAEKYKLNSIIEELPPGEKKQIFEQGKKLLENQNSSEDLTCLPTLLVEDISKSQEVYQVEVGPRSFKDNPHVIVTSVQPTNGVNYFSSVIPIDEMREEVKPYVPLFCNVLTQVGTETTDYIKFSEKEDLYTGGLDASVATSCVHNRMTAETTIKLSSHCLDRNTSNMFGLWQELFHGVNMNDDNRLRTLIRQNAQDLANSVSISGHVFAMRSASQYMSPSAFYDEMFSGLQQVKLMQQLAENDDVTEVKARLREIADFVLRKHVPTHAEDTNGRSMLHVTSGSLNSARSLLEEFVDRKPDQVNNPQLFNELLSQGVAEFVDDKNMLCRPLHWKKFEERIPETLKKHHELPTHVNFTSMCIPTPHSYTDELSPTLRVAAKLLSTKFLHREIREKGGAYGGGARHGSDGLFRFFSYRDPNNTETINSFLRSLRWMVNGSFDERDVDESKLSVFQSVDAPVSPCNRGMDFFLHGLTNEMRQKHRERLLAVKKEDLLHAAASLLNVLSPGMAIIGPPDKSISSDEWVKAS